jgi:hypothetical protein
LIANQTFYAHIGFSSILDWEVLPRDEDEASIDCRFEEMIVRRIALVLLRLVFVLKIIAV